MNTLDGLQPGQQSTSSSNKGLWVAVGVLGAAVLAMGGTMLYQQGKSAATPPPIEQVASVVPKVVAPAASASAADDLVAKPATTQAVPAPAPAPAPVKKVVVKPVPQPAPAPAPVYAAAPAPVPMPAPVPVARICAVCGSVESVTPIQRSTKPDGPGMGAVAGGVLGAVLGNQVGHGGGRTAATIIGAVGGGFAGNAIEKNMRKETVYQVGIRMEDGSQRVMDVAHAPPVGSRVTLEGSSIRTSEGKVFHAPAAPAAHQPQQQPMYSGQ